MVGRVNDVHRLTIRPAGDDPRAGAIARAARTFGIETGDPITVTDVVHVRGPLDETHRTRLAELLVDPLLQRGSWDRPTGVAVEIGLHPGVTDDRAAAVLTACRLLDIPADAAASARRIELPVTISDADVETLTRRVLANPVIERWHTGTLEPAFVDGHSGSGKAATVAIRGASDDELAALDRQRGLALDPAELDAIRSHFVALGRDPTDAELETFAQTWSEHCAHKTFRAAITTGDGDVVEPLISQLRRCTESIAAPFVRSAFVGNAGIVSFHPGVTLALKAETHNHPSAVEPFGGANTGVGGVIRDVLGTGHRPIAATDVLCFGPPDTPAADIPTGSLHPARIRDGVVDGVADYGNKIGLPTVAGAVLYDPGFTTNPLVFCGCIGVGADRPLPVHPRAGDRVVVLGGRTGRDGIRGATFSSATMDATTGEVAGASVQIGDPITEKLLIDVLVGAEHLYRAITDCGAGGLSSAIGEMAEHVGADVELDRVPLKYPGLEPWEIWLSEAQERMVVAVPPENLAELRARCDTYGVELADLGVFTGDRRLVVRCGGGPVVDLDLEFLHGGRPQRAMAAVLPEPNRTQPTTRTVDDPAAVLLALLAHPNVASKADVVRRYDHEILGATVVRPLTGVAADGPSDGVVLADPADAHGLAIGIGVNPWYGMYDPEAMAHAAVDEAIRNAVAAGADPARVALLDNFSWGDPRRPETLGGLVAAVRGCCDAALAHRAPYVSGKDSLNNEYTGTDGERHAVPPTLVITAVAHVPDANRTVTSDLAAAGDVLLVVGTTRVELAGSHLDLVLGAPDEPGVVPQPDPAAPARYRRLHAAMRAGLVRACHDVSEGGLAVTLAEMAIGGRLGVAIERLPHEDAVAALFGESSGRLVVEVAAGDVDQFIAAMDGDALVVGTVSAEPALALPGVAPIPLNRLVAAFAGRGEP
jgi:phosphoribosylformylglycinamidine synthase